MQKQVAWRSLYYSGSEKATLFIDDGIRAESVITWQDEAEKSHTITYRLICRPDWSAKTFTVSSDVANKPLELVSDGAGKWTTPAGEALPALQGCIDIDFQATPLTNILPIRRLQAKVGERTAVKMVYIIFPGLEVYPVEQFYTFLGDNKWLFEQPVDDFMAEIEVDEVGLVKDYPGLFRRLEG